MKLRRYCFYLCLFVCLFVNNFLTTVLVVERWNFQGLVAMLRSGSDSFLEGLGQRSRSKSSKRSNSLNWLNFTFKCHRDFKLGSYFSLWKPSPNMTLTLTSSPKVKIFEISIKETWPKYAWVLCTGHNLLLARWKVKVKVEQKVRFT